LAEIVSYGQFNNLTGQNLIVFIRRTANNIPSNWQSAFCLGVCYGYNVDTASETVTPGAHEFTMHFYPYDNPGLGFATMVIKLKSPPYDSASVTFGARLNPLGVKQISTVVESFNLNQNYPNPFNPVTKIDFSIQKGDYVDLRVYDILGREVKVLLSQYMTPGEYEYEFEAFNLASGMYYYRLKSGDNVAVKKMTLVK
jgi:hypothetical protein